MQVDPLTFPGSLRGYWPNAEINLTVGHVRQLLSLANDTGLRLAFDLNELHGRDCHYHNTTQCNGKWDTSNVRAFLTYVRDNNLGAFLGFENGQRAYAQQPHHHERVHR